MNIKNIFVQKESLRERAVPFVSQMFGLVVEAESLVGGALASEGSAVLSEKKGRQPLEGLAPRQQEGDSRQTGLGNNFIKQMTTMY